MQKQKMGNEPQFQNRIVSSPLSPDETRRAAQGHSGIIKIVVDIKTGKVAAGAKWHSECRDLLVKEGSDDGDCWGAKLDIYSGDIVFKSQINKERPGQNGEEIENSEVREIVDAEIKKYFSF